MTLDRQIEDLPSLPRDDDGPVFREPWEAQAFAMAVGLSAAGHFTWPEWTETFSAAIERAQREGDPDLGDTYYLHWINALERIVEDKGIVLQPEMSSRKDEWRRAYLNTPHGKPIELSAAD